MTRIPLSIAEHELKTYPHIKLRLQRKRSIALDRRKVVKKEVAEWIKAKIVSRASRKHLNLNHIRDSIFQSISRRGYRTRLATHVGYRTLLTILALIHSATSFFTTFLLSKAMLRFLCNLNFMWGYVLSSCSAMERGILVMSTGVQAKASACFV
uniref:Uncharacterized protein n=1 Tax=Tanacetum cinerariifolium TaxID=118510 RepID=A0A699K199_TANCI|nr:hypothetical protein [Tanacetum cinerariifolium]